MLHSSAHGYNLECTAHKAYELDDVDRTGKNDAYCRISFDMKNWEKTVIKKGTTPDWQQILFLRDLKPEHQYVYVEVMDEETGSDEPIGFCAIPLDQIRNAQGQKFSGEFELWTCKSARKGKVCLTFRVIPLGEEPGSALTYEASTRLGVSKLDPEHEKRIKKLKLKESVEDTAKLVGGLAAAGAALGGLFGGKKKTEGETTEATHAQH